MSERPIFEPIKKGEILVIKHNIEFTWYPGFSKEQKQKSLESLHYEARKSLGLSNILEISTKSKEDIGIIASAFNIKIKTRRGLSASVESFYQGSKVFEKGGPFIDLYNKNSLDSKRDERLKVSGDLIGFKFEGTEWGLNDHFYDWLYLNALLQNEVISKKIISYGAFTDIEFNPKKSYNCQAYSAALYKSALLRGYDLDGIKDPTIFKKLFPKEKLISFQLELF
tara:strand:+ start:750 stop:1424 length:675 start_codon:yes stop_codon:yes gene_type:complete